jgi:periplasmic divalent cation tolerance protein
MHVILIVTAPDKKEANRLADMILKKRLAACVNLIPGMTSRYWWKGKMRKGSEVLMVIKTRKALFKKLERLVKENHPYELPEIIAIPIVAGSPEYLNWINSETKG